MEDLEATAGGMGAVAPLRVKALEVEQQALTKPVILLIMWEVMRRSAMLEDGLMTGV